MSIHAYFLSKCSRAKPKGTYKKITCFEYLFVTRTVPFKRQNSPLLLESGTQRLTVIKRHCFPITLSFRLIINIFFLFQCAVKNLNLRSNL